MTTPPVRRDEIMARAAQLFARKGIAGTTVRDIGEVTGLLSGSLYHYFKSKHDIVSEILHRYVDDIHERFSTVVARSACPTDTIRGLIYETLRVIEDHPHPTAIYENERQYLRDHGLLEPVNASSRKVRRYWLTAIEAGIATGEFRDDVPPEIFYRTVRDTLWATVHWPNRAHHSTADFAALMASCFFAGFAREQISRPVSSPAGSPPGPT